MNDLVKRLSEGQHPIVVSLRPERTVAALKECLDRGFVHIKFTETRGGTELGVPIDPQRSNFSGADLERGTGALTIVGDLTLDFVRVRLTAEVQLPDLRGRGHLEPIAQETVEAA
jgi:hypothetical protein